MSEQLDRRVLAAVRAMDRSLDLPVGAPVRLEAATSRWTRNASGTFVLLHAEGLHGHTLSFEKPPSTPAAGTIEVTGALHDPSGTYLSRAFSIRVPRPVGTGPDELFTPVPIYMPPSPTAPVRRTWAAVRVSVRFAPDADAPDGTPIEGAALRLHRPHVGTRCLTLSDGNGEALLIGHGIPLMSAGDDDEAVLSPAVAHEVTVVVDLEATDVRTGRRRSLADPDDLFERRSDLVEKSKTRSLAPGDEKHILFTFSRS